MRWSLKFFIASLLATFLILGGFFIYENRRTFSSKALRVEIESERVFITGRENTLKVRLTNTSQIGFEKIRVYVSLPSQLKTSLDTDLLRFKISKLDPAESKDLLIKAVPWGEKDESFEVEVSVVFIPQGLRAEYEKTVKKRFEIKEVPLTLDLNAPSDLQALREFGMKAIVRSLSDTPIDDLSLEAKLPEELSLFSDFGPPSFSLEAFASKEIELEGSFQKEGEYKVSFLLFRRFQDKKVKLLQKDVLIKVNPSILGFAGGRCYTGFDFPVSDTGVSSELRYPWPGSSLFADKNKEAFLDPKYGSNIFFYIKNNEDKPLSFSSAKLILDLPFKIDSLSVATATKRDGVFVETDTQTSSPRLVSQNKNRYLYEQDLSIASLGKKEELRTRLFLIPKHPFWNLDYQPYNVKADLKLKLDDFLFPCSVKIAGLREVSYKTSPNPSSFNSKILEITLSSLYTDARDLELQVFTKNGVYLDSSSCTLGPDKDNMKEIKVSALGNNFSIKIEKISAYQGYLLPPLVVNCLLKGNMSLQDPIDKIILRGKDNFTKKEFMVEISSPPYKVVY